MARERSLFAGTTDYTAVPITYIVSHVESWSDALGNDLTWLAGYRTRLARFQDSPARDDGLDFTDYFIDLFQRYRADLHRLAQELRRGVYERHIALVSQLYQGARDADRVCVTFKQDHRLDALSPSNELQQTLAEAYRHNRDAVIDLFDLSNIVPRLKTFVTTEPQPEAATDALELKPNVFGIGINFNSILKRLRFPKRR